jgi:hypothetical protein
MKRKVQIIPTTIVKSIEPIAKTKTQPIKLSIILIHYPCIIYFSAEHIFGKCFRKIEVQNMFKTKRVSSNVTTTPKSLTMNNVPTNVAIFVAICNQQLE